MDLPSHIFAKILKKDNTVSLVMNIGMYYIFQIFDKTNGSLSTPHTYSFFF